MNHLLSNQYVLHLPGNGKDDYAYLLDEARDIDFSVDENISIISPMTSDYEEVSALAYQLNRNNVGWINPVHSNNFIMTDKIVSILEALRSVYTEYALVLDGGDTCICKDLDKDFIAKYQSIGKPVIYNTTTKRFPNVTVEPIGLFFQEHKVSFLNAGVCFGKVEDLIKIYELASELVDEIPNPQDSEQLIIRHCRVRMLDTIGVDSDSILFRSAHKGELNTEE